MTTEGRKKRNMAAASGAPRGPIPACWIRSSTGGASAGMGTTRAPARKTSAAKTPRDGRRSASTPVVVTLVGTRDDPQGRDETATRLARAGAWVHSSNAAATKAALSLVAEVTA